MQNSLSASTPHHSAVSSFPEPIDLQFLHACAWLLLDQRLPLVFPLEFRLKFHQGFGLVHQEFLEVQRIQELARFQKMWMHLEAFLSPITAWHHLIVLWQLGQHLIEIVSRPTVTSELQHGLVSLSKQHLLVI